MANDIPATRIDALVRLLGDDDPKILGVAWDHLEEIGARALPFLEEASKSSCDPRVRVQSSRFLTEWSRREVFRRWVAFCRSGEVSLEEGVFLIAETEYPGTPMEPYRRMLDRYAEALRQRLATARTTEEAVKRIAALLFQELQLRGNSAQYYDPDNSYLHRVLDLKRGIPISLASIFLLVARRLSVPVEGVNMPQCFLLKFRSSRGEEQFIDAFGGGRILTLADCLERLEQASIPFHEDCLRAVTDREILLRMLGNLMRIYDSIEDTRRRDRVVAMLKLLS